MERIVSEPTPQGPPEGGPVDGRAELEARLIAVVHTKASRANVDTVFVLGQIIEALGLSERYRDYAREAGSKPVSLKEL